VEEALVAAQLRAPLYRVDRILRNGGLNAIEERRELTVTYNGTSVNPVMPGNNLKLEEFLTRSMTRPPVVYIGTAMLSFAECVGFEYSTTSPLCSLKAEATRLPTREIGTVQAIFKYEVSSMNERSATMLIVEY
jgi:hypothetical protein